MVLFYSITHDDALWWSHNIYCWSVRFCSANAFITYFWTRVYNFFLYFKYIFTCVYVIVDQPPKYAIQLLSTYVCGFLFIIFWFFGWIKCIYNVVLCCCIGSAKMMILWRTVTWKTRRERADRINKSYARTVSIQLLFIMVYMVEHGSVFGYMVYDFAGEEWSSFAEFALYVWHGARIWWLCKHSAFSIQNMAWHQPALQPCIQEKICDKAKNCLRNIRRKVMIVGCQFQYTLQVIQYEHSVAQNE